MNSKPLFTIAVPVYNKRQFLPKLLESIAQQTYTNYEICFVDDGSTDDSREFIDGYARKYPDRIRLINNSSNLGLSSTRNVLLANARGDYIVFVDPDDSIEPDLLKVLTEYTERNVDLIKFQMNVINDEPDKDKDRFTYPAFPDIKSGEEALNIFSADSKKRYAVACTVCYRREFLNRIGIKFPEGLRLHEDVAFIPIAIAYAETVAMIDYRGYNYVRNNQSLTGKIRDEKDPIKMVKAIQKKQQAFSVAIYHAMEGVAEAPISQEKKKLFIDNMLHRLAELTASCKEKGDMEEEKSV